MVNAPIGHATSKAACGQVWLRSVPLCTPVLLSAHRNSSWYGQIVEKHFSLPSGVGFYMTWSSATLPTARSRCYGVILVIVIQCNQLSKVLPRRPTEYIPVHACTRYSRRDHARWGSRFPGECLSETCKAMCVCVCWMKNVYQSTSAAICQSLGGLIFVVLWCRWTGATIAVC